MTLREDLQMESLDAMNIIMEMEKQFQVETDLEEILERKRIQRRINAGQRRRQIYH